MSASTGRGGAVGIRIFGSDAPPACRSIYASASLTLPVPQRCLHSSTRSPPVASAKSYHSFRRSFTLKDGVHSARSGERYQYCSDFTYRARCPSRARKSTIRTCFASAMVMSVSFHLFAQNQFSLVYVPIYSDTKLN